MSCDTSIDDDALLSGLPSWNEKVKYTNRSAMPEQMEPALPDMTIESTTRQKTIPSITKITAEDDKRMALRMAALKTLKTRSKKKLAREAPEANAGDDARPRNDAESTHSSTSLKYDDSDATNKIKADEKTAMNINVETLKQPAQPVIQKTFDYTDIDAPSAQSRGGLDYIPFENEETSNEAQSSRKRISYADEFSAHPVAPSGDDGGPAWLNRVYDASSKSALNPFKGKSQHFHMEKSGSQISSQIREQSPAGRFIEEPWRPIIIEWSDDDDENFNEDESDNGKKKMESNIPYAGESEALKAFATSELSSPRTPHSPRTEIRNKSSTLSLKEREIQNMMAKIKELESRKCHVGCDDDHTAADNDFQSTLGKRSTNDFEGSITDQTQEHMEMQESRKVSHSLVIEYNIFKRARIESASTAMTWIKTCITNVCVFLVDFAIEASV